MEAEAQAIETPLVSKSSRGKVIPIKRVAKSKPHETRRRGRGRPTSYLPLREYMPDFGEVQFEKADKGEVRVILPSYANGYWEIIFENENGAWTVSDVTHGNAANYFKNEMRGEGVLGSLKSMFKRDLLPSVASWAAIHQDELFAEPPDEFPALIAEADDLIRDLALKAECCDEVADEFRKSRPRLAKEFRALDSALMLAAKRLWQHRNLLRKEMNRQRPSTNGTKAAATGSK